MKRQFMLVAEYRTLIKRIAEIPKEHEDKKQFFIEGSEAFYDEIDKNEYSAARLLADLKNELHKIGV